MDDRTDDAELLGAVARGDRDAFEQLYDRYARPLHALGLRWLHDPSEAEELVHDTLMRAWRLAGRYDPSRGRVASWLFGIARHVASDRWRAANRGAPSVPLDGLERWSEGASDEQVCDAIDVAAALERLPALHREVLLLAYAGGKSQSEIARELGIPLGTVKSRTFHGLRRMAELLGGAGPARVTSEVAR